MSRENVEIVRRGFDAFNADDSASFVDAWDTECEFFSVTGSQMEATPYRGPAGIRRYLEETAEAWTALRLDAERILQCKEQNVVVAIGRLKGHGRKSDVAVEQRVGLVFELRGEKIRYCRAYSDPAEALEAAGLRE